MKLRRLCLALSLLLALVATKAVKAEPVAQSGSAITSASASAKSDTSSEALQKEIAALKRDNEEFRKQILIEQEKRVDQTSKSLSLTLQLLQLFLIVLSVSAAIASFFGRKAIIKWIKGLGADIVKHEVTEDVLSKNIKEAARPMIDELYNEVENLKKLKNQALGQPLTAETEKAMRSLEASAKAKPEDERTYAELFALGLDAYNSERFEDAYKYWKKADGIRVDSTVLGYLALTAWKLLKYDEAEEFFERALKLVGEEPIILENYACFLAEIRENYGKAEEYYLKALKGEPKNATLLGDFAGFLLARGRSEEGLSHLDHSFSSNPETAKQLLTALWFLTYAHIPDRRKIALKKLKMHILVGKRSPGWDSALKQNIERAKLDGHPNVELLTELAEVITKGADVKRLEKFPEWNEA